ncbi:hypothetical protein SARC_08725 [Sphaeroforma arctica JP610]|uniref:Uncharacterized protein n=1 Tax=Sphaeroforma arctica JP610 TaxID=667725 RepID=A0A0L0FPY3_9EUKA|nr:hypothetical protein SARC_08725 [Sphaeroforma arctica JP610]KNC78862.1 hypothetical protein SARC_08725 [Sphaeroforma arctica JP610]|eukprot:XP_014152764.1 hypothetical protein SARC_08725 [Sphaeroforma arctica JP610]
MSTYSSAKYYPEVVPNPNGQAPVPDRKGTAMQKTTLVSPSDSGYDSSGYSNESPSETSIHVRAVEYTPVSRVFTDHEHLGFACNKDTYRDTNLSADEARDRLLFLKSYTSRRWK